MEGKNKNRIMSQQHRNLYQKSFKQDKNLPRTLKKIASLRGDTSSPTRGIQKLGRAAHLKYREAVQNKEIRRDQNQNQPAKQSDHKSNFKRKVSQQNLRNVVQLAQKIELTNYKSSLHVLANAQYGEKIRLQKLKKTKDSQRIYFTKGNNHQLLKELFVDKYGFNQTSIRQNAKICWLQSSSQKDNSRVLSKSIHQDHLPDIKRRKIQTKVIYNYLEGQSELTNKQKLYKNMAKSYPQAIDNYIPKSFIIDFRLDQAQIQENLLEFLAYYFKKDKNKRPRNKSIIIKNYYADITVSHKQLNKLIQRSELPEDQPKSQKTTEQQKMEHNDHLWILKPTYLNRGRGIHLFATLKQLSKLLSETPFEISVKMYSDNVKPMTYIIQEYIDRPLLIDGYKFDMRFWVMLQVVKAQGKKTLKAYLFKDGYIRLASVKYEMIHQKQEQNQKQESKEDKHFKREKKTYINNKYIHLTNNAVQKDAKDYGQFCEGNQLSLQKMVQYFHQKNKDCPLNLQQLLQNIVKIVTESVNCVKERLVDLNHTKTFQLLGYDFLLDQNYKMWLIEANCNPCLQQSSALVGNLLRKMISGLIHLTNLSEGKGPQQSFGWIELI